MDLHGLGVPEIRARADEYYRQHDWAAIEALDASTANEKGFKAEAWARKAVDEADFPERMEYLQKLAQDDDWRVRERVAMALKYVNAHAFEQVQPVWKEWVEHEDNYVRRACEVGLMGVGDEDVGPALELVDPLVSDDDDYVKKSCGAFAVTSIAAKEPAVGGEYLDRWSRSQDVRTRWNVAKALGGAYGRETDHAMELAYRLAGDEAYRVRRATAASLRNLFESKPEKREHVDQWEDREEFLDRV